MMTDQLDSDDPVVQLLAVCTHCQSPMGELRVYTASSPATHGDRGRLCQTVRITRALYNDPLLITSTSVHKLEESRCWGTLYLHTVLLDATGDYICGSSRAACRLSHSRTSYPGVIRVDSSAPLVCLEARAQRHLDALCK